MWWWQLFSYGSFHFWLKKFQLVITISVSDDDDDDGNHYHHNFAAKKKKNKEPNDVDDEISFPLVF